MVRGLLEVYMLEQFRPRIPVFIHSFTHSSLVLTVVRSGGLVFVPSRLRVGGHPSRKERQGQGVYLHLRDYRL